MAHDAPSTPSSAVAAVPPSGTRTLAAWASRFDVARLPVLAATVDELTLAREQEDNADAHSLAQVISSDPLMTLKLFAHLGWLRRGRDSGEPETVTAALVMLGVTPFFRQFSALTSVDDALSDRPEALAGFQDVLHRCHRAAHFATAFAAQRLDHDVAVIGSAALLHDFADLLLWLHEPDAAQLIRERQRADPSLRSAAAQQQVLGITLPELQHELMLRWRLPKLLSQIADDAHHNDSAQVRNVVLAVRLARHTAIDWQNPAVPDDVREIAELLHLGIEPTRQLLIELSD
jgi:HD-like signal output (HDOD) protein